MRQRTRQEDEGKTKDREDAMADASEFCTYYHSTPAVLADRAGTISRFECTHRY